jgi:hypothetical protein
MHDLEFLKAVGELVSASGFPVTFEYPGYLCYVHKESNGLDVLVNIGPQDDGRWTADWTRDNGATVEGGWEVSAEENVDTAEVVADRIVEKLKTEQPTFPPLTSERVLDIVSRALTVLEEDDHADENVALICEMRIVVKETLPHIIKRLADPFGLLVEHSFKEPHTP